MTKAQIELNIEAAFNDLNIAKAAIAEGNFWIAETYLMSAIKSANRAGVKKVASAAMRALQNVRVARFVA